MQLMLVIVLGDSKLGKCEKMNIYLNKRLMCNPNTGCISCLHKVVNYLEKFYVCVDIKVCTCVNGGLFKNRLNTWLFYMFQLSV